MTKVYLVGAGPGDPDLITVKGRRALESADAVLFDGSLPAALLALAPAQAERIPVATTPHHEICALLIDRVRRGCNVVRLTAGDPFLFGPCAGEAEALSEAGVPFEIVPGITVAQGAAAYTGVPLTPPVTFASESLVISGERGPNMPAIAVSRATQSGQEAVTGTLAALIERAGMKPPITIIAGETVHLREKLNWFERLPLFGQRIVVTRAAGQAGALASRLVALGAEAIELPTIEIQPAADYGPLDHAIANLASYDWLIFTSANAVRVFVERLDGSAADLRSLRARICAIGPATRAAIESLHLKVDLMGAEYVAEGLLRAFEGHPLAGARILLPRAAVARDLIPTELSRRGAQVDVVEAYRTIVPPDAAARAHEVFAAGPKPDWIAFTSSSTVQNFVAVAGAESLAGVRVASIGPITTRTARELGIEVAVEARTFTIDGLVEAMLR